MKNFASVLNKWSQIGNWDEARSHDGDLEVIIYHSSDWSSILTSQSLGMYVDPSQRLMMEPFRENS